MGETSLALLLHMVEGREDEVGNTHGLGNIGHVSALGVFNVGIHGFPVVSDQEDSVGALESSSERVDRTQIGLM